jgi:hypothetical protein
MIRTRLQRINGPSRCGRRSGRDLWSHLQIEDGLVFSWGEAHHAMSDTLLDSLKNERQKMRKLMAALRALSSGVDRPPHTADSSGFAQTLPALALTLDSHVDQWLQRQRS